MSISGDTLIMRNGRTTSQVSIYNYPEHLNPFYEDDQHKRLRFWQVNKKNDNERWKSISITSLKDIWPLKSFRLHKKKSSTLGINKTSESPPVLRREDYSFGSPIYRSSYQPSSKRATSMGFERNDQYRSTIQMGGNQTLPSGYNYGRSVTPQPQRSFLCETPTLSRRSCSRTSTTSTNPFEDSDEEETFGRGQLQTQSLTPAQRKQKRRAPIPKALVTESEPDSHVHTDLRIEEDDDLNISNLSSQIQSFVDTSMHDEDYVTSTPVKSETRVEFKQENLEPAEKPQTEVITVKTEETPKSVTSVEFKQENLEPQVVTIIEEKREPQVKSSSRVQFKQENLEPEVVTTIEEKSEPVVKGSSKVQFKESSNVEPEVVTTIEEKREPEIRSSSRVQFEQNSNVEVKIVEEKREPEKFITVKTPFILTTPPTPEIKEPAATVNLEQPELREIAILGQLVGPEKPKRSSLNKRTIQFLEMEQETSQPHKCLKNVEQETASQSVLVIEEEQKRPNNVANQEIQSIIAETNSLPLKIVEMVEDSKANGTGAIPRTSNARDWVNSTLAPLPSSVPMEKRKTAKEIIESINRQQRLLKQAAERNMPETRNSIKQRLTGVITYNYYTQTATNSNDGQSNNLDHKSTKLQNGHATNYVESVENQLKDPNKLENGSPVFAKCRVFKDNYPERETSPTSSNLDWNPLPKPKRNKDINLEQ